VLFGFSWGNADAAAILADALVCDLAVDQGEQAVVATLAHSPASLDVGASLADDDRPRAHCRAAEDLDPKALRVGVAAVAGGTAALLVCHYCIPSAAVGSAGLVVERARLAGFLSALPAPLAVISTPVTSSRAP